jgi:hypothetical protein
MSVWLSTFNGACEVPCTFLPYRDPDYPTVVERKPLAVKSISRQTHASAIFDLLFIVRFWWRKAVMVVLIAITVLCIPRHGCADSLDDFHPVWEPLLWGGTIGSDPSHTASTPDAQPSEATGAVSPSRAEPDLARRTPLDVEKASRLVVPEFFDPPALSMLPGIVSDFSEAYQRLPYRVLALKSIPPLYTSPVLPGEGVWEWKGLPTGDDGRPVLYRTSYRPSVDHPNAIVHMLLFDMKYVSMKLYIGSSEPGGSNRTAKIDLDESGGLVAITNALWKLRHSGNAGSIYRGNVIRELAPGVATLVVYKDGSVDILEWNTTIPISLVSDAKQLRHLIVRDGQVVSSIIRGGRTADSEIGLGYLLAEDQSSNGGGDWGGYWGGYWNPGPAHTSGPEWYIATRSAFGIRPDGNLVFAVGRHVSTKDMAKALVLAGCVRAIHGDANPFNVLGNLYYEDEAGNLYKKAKLSPDQSNQTLSRYVGSSYPSDFFAFFLKRTTGEPS